MDDGFVTDLMTDNVTDWLMDWLMDEWDGVISRTFCLLGYFEGNNPLHRIHQATSYLCHLLA